MFKDSSLHIAARDSIAWWKAWLVRLIAVLLSLIVCAIVIFGLTKMNPVEVYKGIFSGAVGTSRRAWVTIRDTMVLLLIAIGLTPAFKMKFWNIGAEGQILVGGAATAALMQPLYGNVVGIIIMTAALMIYAGDSLPTPVLMILMFVASMAAGVIWGVIPAIFKAYFNTNETLFTLMLNYVAMQIVTFCIVYWENPAGSNTVGIINSATRAGWLPELGGLTYGWNVVIVLVFTIGMYIYMKYSKQGYEVAVVGESQDTARYARINVKRTIIRTMGISGGICGVAGFLLVSGASHTISTSTAGGRGFTAIIVAWLSKFNAFVMILVSFFLVFMEKGAIQIASQFNLNENASDVITGIILFFILGSEFFIRYRIAFTKAHK